MSKYTTVYSIIHSNKYFRPFKKFAQLTIKSDPHPVLWNREVTLLGDEKISVLKSLQQFIAPQNWIS